MKRRVRGILRIVVAMNRYAAKLLFQYRVSEITGQRICEESIIHVEARSKREALKKAKARGKDRRRSYDNADGNRVYFEFVGILDLISLGIECEPDEVWYDIYRRVNPMERREKILPKEKDLLSRITE